MSEFDTPGVEAAAEAMWLYRPMERSEFGAPVPFADAKEYQRTRYLGLARVAMEASNDALKVKMRPDLPAENCQTRLMDGRNELRCWFLNGHEGDCK